MDKDFLKFMSFVAFMEAKKEAERDCSAEDTGWQDTIPTIRRKPDPAREALLLSRIRMPEKPVNKMESGEKVFMGIGIIGLFDAAFGLFLMDAFYFLVGLVVGVSFIIMATSNAKRDMMKSWQSMNWHRGTSLLIREKCSLSRGSENKRNDWRGSDNVTKKEYHSYLGRGHFYSHCRMLDYRPQQSCRKNALFLTGGNAVRPAGYLCVLHRERGTTGMEHPWRYRNTNL